MSTATSQDPVEDTRRERHAQADVEEVPAADREHDSCAKCHNVGFNKHGGFDVITDATPQNLHGSCETVQRKAPKAGEARSEDAQEKPAAERITS